MELSCICRAAWEVWLDFMGILLYTISILSESKENMR